MDRPPGIAGSQIGKFVASVVTCPSILARNRVVSSTVPKSENSLRASVVADMAGLRTIEELRSRTPEGSERAVGHGTADRLASISWRWSRPG
jgi:hypothetical protein